MLPVMYTSYPNYIYAFKRIIKRDYYYHIIYIFTTKIHVPWSNLKCFTNKVMAIHLKRKRHTSFLSGRTIKRDMRDSPCQRKNILSEYI